MMPDLYRQTAYVARWVSTSARGDHVYSEPEAFACRYEPSTRLLRTADGGQKVSEAVLYCGVQVTPRDLIYPPGADQTDYRQSRRPLRVDTHHDLDSGQFSHSEIHI